MATVAISGKGGTVTGANGASEVKTWTNILTTEALDATSFDSNSWIEVVPGLRGSTGSLTAIGVRPTDGAAAALALGTGSQTISGAAILSSVETTVVVDGTVVEYSADYTFSGEVSVA